MKLLITGGAGFIGSHFIKYILRKYQDYQIINLDKLTYCGNLDNLRSVENDSRYRFIKGDICNLKFVNRIASKRPDAIINFASETHVDQSILNPKDFIKTDILGTHNLLEATERYKIERFIQISTDEVYGSIRRGSFSEKRPLNPSTPYATAKAAADLIVRSYFVTYKTPVLIARPSNNFGPNQYPEKIIPLFITNLLENKKVPLYGDGLNVREWLFVLDDCRAIDLILHKGKEGEIYNVGGGNKKTNLEVTRLILKEMKRDNDSIEYVKDRLCHDRRYSLNCNKIKREMNWEPRYGFELALKRTISWYENNRWWWEKLKSKKGYQKYYKKQYSNR